jgi:hypothetical protein
MPRHNELEKTWLPGPSRGTQTFNAPANLTIDYGRHVATISGRGGSGNNPGAQYSILYNTNYNVAYPVANYGANYSIVYTTNYNIAYPIATQPEASRPITGYNATYNIAYPVAATPAVYNIAYNTNYTVSYPVTGYGVNYGIAYPVFYNAAYPVSYNVTYPVFYNAAYPVSYNVTYPVFYNTAYPVSYNVAYPASYTVVYGVNYTTIGVQDPPGTPPIVGTGTYNPATSFNWNAVVFYEVEKLVSKPGFPIEYSVFINNTNYTIGYQDPVCPTDVWYVVQNYNTGQIMQQMVTYEVVHTCTPTGNFENYNANFTTNYNIANYNAEPLLSYNVAYPVNYNIAYGVGYNAAYPVSYNVVYPAAYNIAYPVNYNVAYPAAYNVAYPFTGNNTSYTVAYPIVSQPEASRPINAYNANYNIAYPVAATPAVYVINYNTNYNVAYPQGNQPESSRPVVGNNTNYNVAYPIAATPEASRPIVGYSPGVPGSPTTVLGVTFPGGAVGSLAPYVPETVVKYWDYPDYQTHPVVVPSGGEIVIKLE